MKLSSGILLYRVFNGRPEVFLVHPGGPFFKNKDTGAWSIPKGELLEEEDPLEAARREFREETGQDVSGAFIDLGMVTQKSGKRVHCWAVEGDIDHEKILSNVFELEWPPASKKLQSFPEIDRAGWFDTGTAKQKINPAQAVFIDRLLQSAPRQS